MKKSFLLLAGAAAVLASCSKTETTDRPQGSAIGFAGAWIGHAVESKAQNDANITTEGIDHFFVFGGYEGFNNVFGTAEAGEQAIGTKVTKAADSWTYSPVRYWVEDKTYDFAAYSPDLTDVATVAADAANKAISFTNFVSDKDHQHDLIYAHVSNKRYSSPSAMRFP